jgi:flagellar biosynthetic protein FliR
MLVSLELPWILSVLLVSLRFGVVILLTPVFSLIGLPLKIRVVLVLALSATLVAGMDPAATASVSAAPADLLLGAAKELALGSMLAFGLLAGFGAFQLAGRILDIQLGFGVAGLIDPTTRTQAPLLGTVLNMAAVLTFFLIDGHHLLIRGLAYSLVEIPPGSSLRAIPADLVVAQFGAMFVFAALLAAPVMTVVLLVDIALAMMARTMPQMNVFIIGLPLKIFVGLLVLAIALGFLEPAFELVFKGLFENWHSLVTR